MHFANPKCPAASVNEFLAVVSELILSTSGAMAHDFYVKWIQGRQYRRASGRWSFR
jgi:hypothetical protein